MAQLLSRGNNDFAALSIYLSAAHHGKVRTVLASRTAAGEDVCGIRKTAALLPWNEMPLDFSCAVDGASGRFSEDGLEFVFEAPGWTGLVADLLGGWEKDAEPGASVVPFQTAEPRNLGAVRVGVSRNVGALRRRAGQQDTQRQAGNRLVSRLPSRTAQRTAARILSVPTSQRSGCSRLLPGNGRVSGHAGASPASASLVAPPHWNRSSSL